MKPFSRLSIAVCLLVSLPVYAGKFVAMPEVGTGRLNVDQSFALPDGYDGEDDIYAVGFIGGYKFDSNVVLAIGLSFSGTEYLWDAEDEYTLNERGVLIGYSFNVNANFRIVPMLGWNSWDLVTEEGAFLNSGPEEELEFNGTDTYGRLNFEFPITEVFQMVASYVYGDYDFGRSRTTRVGFKFEF